MKSKTTPKAGRRAHVQKAAKTSGLFFDLGVSLFFVLGIFFLVFWCFDFGGFFVCLFVCFLVKSAIFMCLEVKLAIVHATAWCLYAENT